MINDQRMKQETTWETTNAYTREQDHIGDVENSVQKSKGESQLSIEECRSLTEEVRILIATLGQMSIGLSNLFMATITAFSIVFAAISLIFAAISLSISLIQLENIPPEYAYRIRNAAYYTIIPILIVITVVLIFLESRLVMLMIKLKPFKEWKLSIIAIRKLLMNRRDVIKNCCREICSQKTSSKNLMLCEDLKVLSDTLNEILTDKRVLKSILESLKNLLMGKRFRS